MDIPWAHTGTIGCIGLYMYTVLSSIYSHTQCAYLYSSYMYLCTCTCTCRMAFMCIKLRSYMCIPCDCLHWPCVVTTKEGHWPIDSVLFNISGRLLMIQQSVPNPYLENQEVGGHDRLLKARVVLRRTFV